MARQLRIQAEGLTYHVTARGTGRMAIYRDARDRREFLSLLGRITTDFHLTCHAYCLMDNHYHLVITTSRANVSKAVQTLNGRYAQRWNRRHGRVGHLFQGRFHAQIVQDGDYFATVCRYLALNPVRARMVAAPERWRWSSFAATVGVSAPPRFLYRDVLLALFGDTVGAGARGYWRFVLAAPPEGVALPRARLLGDEAFVQRFSAAALKAPAEIPQADRLAAHALPALFARAASRRAREAAVVRAYLLGHSLVSIARFLGMHYTTVGRIVARRRAGSDRDKSDEARCDP